MNQASDRSERRLFGLDRAVRWTPRSTPDIDATDLAVAVRNGMVMLTVFARSEIEKYEAERLAKRVAGVLGLTNDIEAHPAWQ